MGCGNFVRDEFRGAVLKGEDLSSTSIKHRNEISCDGAISNIHPKASQH